MYVIAGEGDLRGELQQLAESLEITDAVKFLGPVAHDALPSLYRAADVFVMPSTGEGFGIVYLESIACGTPVIAGESDGAEDPAHDGKLGTLVPPRRLRNAIAAELSSAESAHQAAGGNLDRAESVSRFFGRAAFLGNVQAITHHAISLR